MTAAKAAPAVRLIFVTGISGAGKTSALKALEDLGYEALDNMPLSLLGDLVIGRQRAFEGAAFDRRIAIGIDIRTRDFAAEAILGRVADLKADADLAVSLLFVDCDDEEVRRRYEETRHRHPLAADRPIADGLARERQLLASLRDAADFVLDTTGLGPGDLKRILEGHYGAGEAGALALFVTSFAFRRGLPRDADLVFDVRFLGNPHYDPALRPLSGKDEAVRDFITKDPDFATFFERLTGLLSPLLPRYKAEGKSYLTIAVGCTGGRHRSVFVAEKLASWLEENGQRVEVVHRDLDGPRG